MSVVDGDSVVALFPLSTDAVSESFLTQRATQLYNLHQIPNSGPS